MSKISHVWQHIQTALFPFLEENLDPLTDKQKKLAAILELVRIEDFIPAPWWVLGRPPKDRVCLAKAFLAKMVYNCSTTRGLIELLLTTPNLRRLCGWKQRKDVPSEATFSRSFKEFSESGLPERAHEALIKEYESERLVGHISRDATDIVGREKAAPKPKKEKKKKQKRGRPKKGECRPPKEPSCIEKQLTMELDEILETLPRACDWGTKKKNGKTYHWSGYKVHVDWADGEIPISVVLTSASTHDSQAAIPLAVMSAERVTNLYDLMDAAYDAWPIKSHSLSLGHIPIIDHNPRRGEKSEMEPAVKRRYDERSTGERGFSIYKDDLGGRNIRVKGDVKVMTHVMFGMLALAADRLLGLLTC